MCLIWNIVLTSLFLLASAAFGQPYEERPWKPIRASTRNNGNYRSTYRRSHQPYEERPRKPIRASTRNNGNYRSTYRRSQEVEEKCNGTSSGGSDSGTGTSSSSSKQDGPLPTWAMEKQLSFQNGEWEQAAGSSPLLPFQPHGFNGSSKVSIDGVKNMSYDPIQFASFWITDMNQKTDGKRQEAVQVSAVLQLAIRAYQDLGYLIGNGIEEFLFDQGSSVLTILLEGFHTESEAGSYLCMLGCTLLPQWSSNVSNNWSNPPLNSIQSPPTSRTCNLMLQLHYPTEMSLTSRAIRGVLKSLSRPGEWSYFHPITVVSQMGADASYEFRAGGLVKEACKGATPSAEDTEIIRGDHICAIVRESLNGQQLEPLFNWKCNKSEEYCTKLGPFKTKGGLPVPRNGSKILIQDVRCVDRGDERSGKAANISAVFRAIPPSQDQNLVFGHTGLDGLTLVAEGIWSSGKLCMIACAHGSQEYCKIRICLYIPTELSITQRSVLVGTISSLDGKGAISFDPLSFHQPVSPGFRPNILTMHYVYSKIKNVGAIMKREQPLGETEKIIPSFRKYPPTGSHYSLSEDLRVHSPIISQKNFHSLSYFDLDIIAIENSVVTDWTSVSHFSTEDGPQIKLQLAPLAGHVGPEEEGKFVKLAAQLLIRHPAQLWVTHPDNSETRSPVIHGEGLYNPRTGKMYLVGCQEVSAAWQVLQNKNFELVDGLDCNVEVIVRFPPKNAWLVQPRVSVTITSRRTKDDPFFSPEVSFQISEHLYRLQRKEIVSRESLEAGLRLVTLSLMPMCIASQLIYIKKNKDSAPFISIVMLGVQAMGYGVPLIVSDKALYAKRHFDRHEARFSGLGEGEWTQEIMFLNKLLILVAFLLNMHLCQKVVKARIQLRTQRQLEPGRIPSERKVLLIFLLIHAVSFLIHALVFMLVLTIHSLYNKTDQVTIRSVEWQQPAKNQNAKWVKEILMGYGGVMQDLFLLPQVLGGVIWDVQGKPLRPLYYIGLTILCMLPHAFYYSREPIFNADYANLPFEGNIAIPVLTLVLAIAVYDQQRWKDFRKGSSKLMHCHGSNMLERLPSKLFEAEAVPNIPPSSSHQDSENGNGS